MTDILFTAALEGQQAVLENHAAAHGHINWDDIRDALGHTLLALAASRGKLHIIEYLEAAGARLDIPNKAGKAAIEIAYEGGHPNTTRGIIRLYKKNGLAIPLSADVQQALAA